MNIGELDGVKVMLSPEAYAEVKKQKIIEENKILKEQQQELERYKNIIDELKWKPIEEYEKPKYDWVLVKYFIEPNFECIPCVAENRFGKWYDRNDNLINGEVRYFADMQLLDTLGELKGE